MSCAPTATSLRSSSALSRTLSSARLDNLTSVHACLRGLLDADGDTINLAVLYDNEEIGSNTRRGADSSTLTVILESWVKRLSA